MQTIIYQQWNKHSPAASYCSLTVMADALEIFYG